MVHIPEISLTTRPYTHSPHHTHHYTHSPLFSLTFIFTHPYTHSPHHTHPTSVDTSSPRLRLLNLTCYRWLFPLTMILITPPSVPRHNRTVLLTHPSLYSPHHTPPLLTTFIFLLTLILTPFPLNDYPSYSWLEPVHNKTQICPFHILITNVFTLTTQIFFLHLLHKNNNFHLKFHRCGRRFLGYCRQDFEGVRGQQRRWWVWDKLLSRLWWRYRSGLIIIFVIGVIAITCNDFCSWYGIYYLYWFLLYNL